MAINEALAEYLALYHKGEANAVTSRELECSFQMRGSELRREINALRGDGIPVCSFEGGYYYAATAEELERTIRQLRSRINIIMFIYISDLQFLCQEKNRSRSKNGKQYTET